MNKAACWPPGGRALARASRTTAAIALFSAKTTPRRLNDRLAFPRNRL